MIHGKRASQNRGMYPKNKIYEECVRSLTSPPLLQPRNFICVRLVIAYLFPKYYTQRDAHSEHHTLRILLFSWFKKLFQPFKSFCRSDKAKHKLVVTKISRIGKSSNIACVASVSNRVTARKLEREQKKNFLFLLSSQLSRRTREETLATQATSNTVSFLFRVSGR